MRKAGLIALITVLGMTPPLSTDMYMPSLPKMADYFGAAPVVVNMTMVAFFISMSVGMLIMGPLSDRSGRKSVLIISLLLYMIASVFCAITSSVYFLILMRIVQGIGAGGMVSLSIAIIKDCFDGSTRATALAVVQSMSVIAPILAPVIGALIIQVSTWRTVFLGSVHGVSCRRVICLRRLFRTAADDLQHLLRHQRAVVGFRTAHLHPRQQPRSRKGNNVGSVHRGFRRGNSNASDWTLLSGRIPGDDDSVQHSQQLHSPILDEHPSGSGPGRHGIRFSPAQFHTHTAGQHRHVHRFTSVGIIHQRHRNNNSRISDFGSRRMVICVKIQMAVHEQCEITNYCSQYFS